uniref:Xaa-Pro dipeptidyl-peptidase C-terminal domain-containing protein n=1 Tax=Globisporangium ultimum (strain ATCC 200006 / CBS 805.95 / DAOM BR144) TaxID=431595 RepID=K3WFD8_GLOUD
MPLHEVQIRDNVWIPIDATIKLSAKVWIPKPLSNGATDKFSVILEYLPYRKADWTSPRDARNHTWMAQRGFAVARVDMRGSGNSSGYDTGEYTKEELADGVVVIDWLAKQDWCTGSVGVFGKSWGGFNGLQLAAMAPPALKGVVSLYSIDDRYADDVHYMGGTVMGSEALSWASVMFAWNARPPAPEAIGDEQQWKDFWRDRLEHHRPWLHDWLSHQSRDSFWEHSSISESYESVKCPVLVIGGWADGYHNGVQRMMSSMTNCFRKGVIGPWSHDWPNVATPGPQVGFLEMCRQWWEHSLNGVENDVKEYPDLQLYVKDTIEDVSPQIVEYPGKWIGVQDASHLHQKYTTFYCRPQGVLDANFEASSDVQAIQTQSLQGAWSGEWLSFGGPDMPGNQANDDSLATTWKTLELTDNIEIVGYPEVSLIIKSSHAQALITARLCDVSPSGKSTLISRGVLNLSHRNGHHPSVLEPMPVDEYVRVTWKLNYCAYNVPVGHKVLLAVTPHYWPLIWPSPEPTQFTVTFAEENTVRLPLLDHASTIASPCPVETYPLDRGASTRAITLQEPAPLERKLSVLLSEVDPSSPHQQELVIKEDEGKSLLVDESIVMEESAVKTYSIDLNCKHPQVLITRMLTYEKLDPEVHRKLLSDNHAAVLEALNDDQEKVERVDFAEHDAIPWKATVTTNSSMKCDADSFFLDDHLVVHLNDAVFFEKTWRKQIKREFV